MRDFDAVLRLEPGNSVAYFNRGSTFDSLGMHDAAIADFGRALELDQGSGGGGGSPGPELAVAPQQQQQQGRGSPLSRVGRPARQVAV